MSNKCEIDHDKVSSGLILILLGVVIGISLLSSITDQLAKISLYIGLGLLLFQNGKVRTGWPVATAAFRLLCILIGMQLVFFACSTIDSELAAKALHRGTVVLLIIESLYIMLLLSCRKWKLADGWLRVK